MKDYSEEICKNDNYKLIEYNGYEGFLPQIFWRIISSVYTHKHTGYQKFQVKYICRNRSVYIDRVE